MCRRLRDREDASPPKTRDAGWEPQLAGRCPEVVGRRLTCMRTYCRDRCGYGAGMPAGDRSRERDPGQSRGGEGRLRLSCRRHSSTWCAFRPRRPSEPRERRDAAPARGALRAQDQIERLPRNTTTRVERIANAAAAINPVWGYPVWCGGERVPVASVQPMSERLGGTATTRAVVVNRESGSPDDATSCSRAGS